MSEMIERVSRALYPERWEGHDVGRELEPDYWASPMETADRARLLARARTAIEAMREPTEAMVTAGCEGIVGGTEGHQDEAELNRIDVTEQWRAMIDAALKE